MTDKIKKVFIGSDYEKKYCEFQIHICEEQSFFCKQLFDFGIKRFSLDIFFNNNNVLHLVLHILPSKLIWKLFSVCKPFAMAVVYSIRVTVTESSDKVTFYLLWNLDL